MNNLKPIVEALLMSSSEPLSLKRLLGLLNKDTEASSSTSVITTEQLREALDALTQDYADRAVELVCLASGYCFQTKSEYGPWISRLFAEKPVKYSAALLETLAIIAYQQPVTRADIEQIRGVSVSSAMLKTLLEREWIRPLGCRDVPGKPVVYGTTATFLDYFNLASLRDLPALVVNE